MNRFLPLSLIVLSLIFGNAGARAETRLHHVHLLAQDPVAVAEFYAARLPVRRTRMFGAEALDASPCALVISAAAEVRQAKTAVWHLGWGALDIRAEYIRQLDLGTPFAQPLEYLLPGAYFAYIAAPHGVEVEINSSKNAGFGHVHLYSLHPAVAGEWYARYLGLRPARPLSTAPVQVGRYALSSAAYLDAGGVGLLIFPKPDGVDDLLPSEGTGVDHLAFLVDNLDTKLADLRRSGARIVAPAREMEAGWRGAMVMGPDRMKIELLERRLMGPSTVDIRQ